MNYYAEVLLRRALFGRDVFTFKLPDKLASRVETGALVEVPVRNARQRGIILSISTREPDFTTREILRPLTPKLLGSMQLDFMQLLAKQNFTSTSKVLKMFLPEPIWQSDGLAPAESQLELITSKAPKRLGFKQQKVLDFLITAKVASSKNVRQQTRASLETIKSLKQLGLIRETFKELHQKKPGMPINFSALPDLNDYQQEALKKVANCPKSLVFGPPSSGKSLIIRQLAARMLTLKSDIQILVIVPEIALSADLFQKFEQIFNPDKLILYHHKMNASEKKAAWWQVKTGEARIILGSRSALFLPFSNLKLIAVEEEHDFSYKSDQAPRYHAVKAAETLSELAKSQLILTSATPRLETLYRASGQITEDRRQITRGQQVDLSDQITRNSNQERIVSPHSSKWPDANHQMPGDTGLERPGSPHPSPLPGGEGAVWVESGEVDGDLQKDLPTSNLQHQTSKFQILNSNIQHPTSNIQARLARSAKGVSSPPGRGGRGEGEGARSEINPQNYQTANRKAKLSTKTLSFARQLRQNQTEAENLLWSQIRDRRLLGIKFRRQHPVGNYILDFYSQELSLAIELDGGQHNEESEIKYDQKRTDFLKSKGVNVLRIWNNEIFENPDGVAEYLYNEVVKIKPEIANRNFDLGREDRSQRAADLDLERPGSPHPSPLPKGEGAVWVEGGEVDGDLQKDLPTSNLQHQTSKFQIPTSKFQLLNSNFSSELELIKLPSNKPLPTATIIDMKTEMQGGNYSPISRELWRKILENLERKQKIILFLNRRGLHSGLICRECGQAVCCPHCQVALAHHRQVASSHKPEASMQQSLLAEEQNNKKLTEFLLCHHCGRVYGEIASCSHCQSTRLEYFGFGTQKVETILKKRLPKAKIIRADRDTTRRKAAARDIFSQFFERDGDILIGTQIITKGFDHEAVGLVGVILADNTLQIPDFRASEKTLQNLIQASGRTGRGTNPGEVVIQTLIPNHLVIQKAAQGDYLGFYQNELKIRDNFHLPPFTRLTRLIFVDRDKQKAYQLARRAEKKLTKLTKNLDPAARVHLAPALVPKKHDKYHVHLLLYSAYPEAILSKANIAKARVDVDAVEVV